MQSHIMGSELLHPARPWQAAANTTDEREEQGAMARRTAVHAPSAPGAPVPLALTVRRHIDLARVSSAACR
ncbi:putative leader peptide [Streptomyces cyaneofuscatus]